MSHKMATFYNEYGITREHFAKLVGVHDTTVRRYCLNQLKRQETIDRIEKGLKIIRENELHWPEYPYMHASMDFFNKRCHEKKIAEIDKKFYELYRREG